MEKMISSRGGRGSAYDSSGENSGFVKTLDFSPRMHLECDYVIKGRNPSLGSESLVSHTHTHTLIPPGGVEGDSCAQSSD